MNDRLAIPPDEFRTLVESAAGLVTSYYTGLTQAPVLEPTTAKALGDLVREPLPLDGAPFGALLETLREVVFRFSRHNGHPRFFGYIASPGSPVTALGSMIEAALNTNVTGWRSAPAATELEHVVINWVKGILGYPAGAAGLLVSGGSMANLAALAAARSAKFPDVMRQGLAGALPTVYTSAEGHFSIRKAAGIIGIGEAAVRAVRTDQSLRMDPAALEQQIREDLQSGRIPLCICATLGTTGTGAVDPIPALSRIARRYGLWLHVDAAYGGFAALAPSARSYFEGVADADSVALDPHKWLYMPVGCGCVLYKDPSTARTAFAGQAEYTRAIGFEQDEAFAFWDYGPELSRPFRALNLWLLLKYAGANRIGEAIESNLRCARHFESIVNTSGDFEMLAPVELSIFCFRHRPRGFSGDLDLWNERILTTLQQSGRSYLSNTRVHGDFALRGCVLNYRTTERDMEALLEDTRAAAAGVRATIGV